MPDDEPTAEELDRLIEEQSRDLPPWWWDERPILDPKAILDRRDK